MEQRVNEGRWNETETTDVTMKRQRDDGRNYMPMERERKHGHMMIYMMMEPPRNNGHIHEDGTTQKQRTYTFSRR